MITVQNKNELDNFVINNSNKIILLYFGASWCGPCKSLKAILKDENTMSKYDKLAPVYIDIDLEDLEDIVNMYSIQSIPAVYLSVLHDDQVKTIDSVIGFNWQKVEEIYYNGLKILSDINDNNNSDSNHSDNNEINNSSND